MLNSLPGYGPAAVPGAPSIGETARKVGPVVAREAAETLVNKGGSAISALINGINKAMPSILPTATAALATLSFRGTQGTLVSIHEDIVLYATFIYTQGLDRENRGTPVYRRFEPRELSGFAQFRDVHIPTENGMTINEAEAIETLLQSGVYLEWGGMA